MTKRFGLDLDRIRIRIWIWIGFGLDHKNIWSLDYLLDMLYFTAFTSVIIMLDNPAMT